MTKAQKVAEAKAKAEEQAQKVAESKANGKVKVVLRCAYGNKSAGSTIFLSKKESDELIAIGWAEKA